jgi:hypothetical protein
MVMNTTYTEEAACPIRDSAHGIASVDPQTAMASTPRAGSDDSAATRSGSPSQAAAPPTAAAAVAVAVAEPT